MRRKEYVRIIASGKPLGFWVRWTLYNRFHLQHWESSFLLGTKRGDCWQYYCRNKKIIIWNKIIWINIDYNRSPSFSFLHFNHVFEINAVWNVFYFNLCIWACHFTFANFKKYIIILEKANTKFKYETTF